MSGVDWPPTFISLKEMRDEKLLCDAYLATEAGTAFSVHRVALAAVSVYFRTLFTSPLRHDAKVADDGKDVYTIPEVTDDILEAVIDFAYTGRVQLSADGIETLLRLADRFQVTGIVQTCCDKLAGQLDIGNAVGIYKIARHYYCPSLTIASRRFLLKNMVDVAATSAEFVDMSAEDLIDILDDDELCVSHEGAVFEMVSRWTKHDPPRRLARFGDLLRTVRFGLVDAAYLKETVLKNQLLRSTPSHRRIATLAADVVGRRGGPSAVHAAASRPRVPHAILFAVGGWTSGNPTIFTEIYDCRAQRWFISLHNDEHPRAYHGLAAVDRQIYVIGGFDGARYFNTVRCFDPASKTWTEKSCMYHQRCYVSVCVLDGVIYALGGYDGRTRLNSGECYDRRVNQWRCIAPMNRPRSDASAAALNGKIYIVGGFTGEEVLNTAETYDPQTEIWSFVASMLTPRSGVSLVSFGGSLYALGGYNGVVRLSSCERYDPTFHSHWTSVAPMHTTRSNFACAVLENRICAVGGFNGATTSPLVESYDPATNAWTEMEPMLLNRSALSACVVEGLENAREFSYASQC